MKDPRTGHRYKRIAHTENGKYAAWDKITDDDLVRMNSTEGMTCTDIGRKYGVNHTTVWQRFKFHKLVFVNRNREKVEKKAPPIEELIGLQEIMTMPEIAKKYGVAKGTVRRWLRKVYKIPVNRHLRTAHRRAVSQKDQHNKATMEELAKFEKEGFRVIPLINKPWPDAILLKDNMVYAMELQFGHSPADFQKYAGTGIYDDVVWILVRQGKHYPGNLRNLQGRFKSVRVREPSGK